MTIEHPKNKAEFLEKFKDYHVDRIVSRLNHVNHRIQDLREQGCSTSQNPMKRLLQKRKIFYAIVKERIDAGQTQPMTYSEIVKFKDLGESSDVSSGEDIGEQDGL